MFANAPRDEDELHLICNKKDPNTGLGGQKWRIDGEALLLDEPEWMPVAREARAQLRAHAAANAEAILARWGGPDAQHLTDDELVEYETKAARQPASDATAVSSEEDEGAKENAGAARNKPAPPKAFAKKVASAPKEPVYTREQLADFDSVKIEGAEYGCNVRGDVVDGDGNFVGHWDPKTTVFRRSSTPPADWESVMSSA